MRADLIRKSSYIFVSVVTGRHIPRSPQASLNLPQGSSDDSGPPKRLSAVFVTWLSAD